MLHTMKYSLRTLIRNKSQCFWLILFPIILGTLFKLAFSNLNEPFEPIPVAIVLEEDAYAQYTESFRTLADSLGEEGDDQMLDITYCDREEALQLLEDTAVYGIITVRDTVSLSVSANANSDKKELNQNILHTFVQRYNLSADAITDIAMNHPEYTEDAMTALADEITYIRDDSLSASEEDNYVSYFYNLLAMTCMFCCMSGMYVSLENQGNLSPLGARRNVAPTSKLVSILGQMSAYVLGNFICILIGFIYINLILQIDLTARLPLVLLTLFVSDLAGSAFGFFAGALGRMSEGTKNGIIVAISMLCCFLSGLMIGNIRILIEDVCPIVNRINPAALISDSFYCLANFDNYTRYTQNIVSLCIFTVLFLAGGFLLTRRRRYASL